MRSASRPAPPLRAVGPLLVGCLLLCLPSLSFAQTPLERIGEFQGSASGFSQVGDPETGTLSEDQDAFFMVELARGSDYMIVSFCEGCTDLDLVLLAPDGEEVQADRLPDAEPILTFTAAGSGRYGVRVEMVECGDDSCPYAAGVFAGELDPAAGLFGTDMSERISSFREELEEEGYVEIDGGDSGTLEEGLEIRFPVSLREGVEYELVGVCDADCEDMDLVLFDPDGLEVDEDLLPDPVPLLSHTPAVTGNFRVGVTMVICKLEPCAYRVVLFARGEGISPTEPQAAEEEPPEVIHEGELEEGDERSIRGGEFYDLYTVELEEGQRFVADLRSTDFDTYLVVLSPDGERAENDDVGEETGHSRVELEAPRSGTYTVVVTSFEPGEEGEYVLSMVLDRSS